MLGDDLLSHGEAPHYHRRGSVSLLSSVWVQVVPNRYGRQAKKAVNRLIVSIRLKGAGRAAGLALKSSSVRCSVRYSLFVRSRLSALSVYDPYTALVLYGQASRAISTC